MGTSFQGVLKEKRVLRQLLSRGPGVFQSDALPRFVEALLALGYIAQKSTLIFKQCEKFL